MVPRSCQDHVDTCTGSLIFPEDASKVGEVTYTSDAGLPRLQAENESIDFEYRVADRLRTLQWLESSDQKLGEVCRTVRMLKLE